MANRFSLSFAGTPGTKIVRVGARPSRRTTARHGNGISSTYLNGLASKPFVCGFEQILTTENTEHAEATDVPSNFWFELHLSFRDLCDLCGKRSLLLEQLSQILK